jgi:hypothetical protein
LSPFVIDVGLFPSRLAPSSSIMLVSWDAATVVAVTTAVAADVAIAEPAELLAVTNTRIVEPTSAEPRRSVLEVAPETAVQEPPLELQRCHW